MLAILFWCLSAALCGLSQGLTLPAATTYVPATSPEARRASFGLHTVGLLAYALPLLLMPDSWPAAVLARALLFDLAINLGAGRPLWQVGQTAGTDKLLQALAVRLSWPASRLRMALWLLACLLAAGFMWHER